MNSTTYSLTKMRHHIDLINKIFCRNPLTTLEDEVNTLALAMRKLEKQVKAAKSKDILPKFKGK